MIFDDLVDRFEIEEYEEIFPEDKEYKEWMESIERDYANEVSR